MYYAPVDQNMEVRTMNLNEELGQISHVFTDKVGSCGSDSSKSVTVALLPPTL